MIILGTRSVSIIVICSIVLHLFWAGAILVDHSALNTNSINALYRYVHEPNLLAAVLVATSVLAIAGIFTSTPLIVLLLIPQQLVLMAAAGGAIESMWLGQFADGILRPMAFIAADQIYSVVIAIGHTVAIITHAIRIAR